MRQLSDVVSACAHQRNRNTAAVCSAEARTPDTYIRWNATNFQKLLQPFMFPVTYMLNPDFKPALIGTLRVGATCWALQSCANMFSEHSDALLGRDEAHNPDLDVARSWGMLTPHTPAHPRQTNLLRIPHGRTHHQEYRMPCTLRNHG